MTSKDDCYFYYYSTCLKGDVCPYRHCANALGNETVCALWTRGKCVDSNCQYRHMKIDKARDQLPCYFETTPSGCLKPHCPFLHLKARKFTENFTKAIMPVKPSTQSPGNIIAKESESASSSNSVFQTGAESAPAPSSSSITLKSNSAESSSPLSQQNHVNPFKESSSSLKAFSFHVATGESSPSLPKSSDEKTLSKGTREKVPEPVSNKSQDSTSQSDRLKARAERFACKKAVEKSVERKSILSVEIERTPDVVRAEKTARTKRLATLKKRWEARREKEKAKKVEEEKKKKKKKKKEKSESKIEKIVWNDEVVKSVEKNDKGVPPTESVVEKEKPKAVHIKRSRPSRDDGIVIKSFDEIMEEKRKRRKSTEPSEVVVKKSNEERRTEEKGNEPISRKRPDLVASTTSAAKRAIKRPRILKKTSSPTSTTSVSSRGESSVGGAHLESSQPYSDSMEIVARQSSEGVSAHAVARREHVAATPNEERDVLDDLESAMKDLSGVAEEGDNSAEGDHDDLMLDIEEVMNI
ncbi:zinc finger CCCH domain-containing protein 11A-like isoform X2 [Oscarella lobularis]|uniref:zinc finger CCCH domain-containing protein 11A-like isoform X2 n=1 Tax=Oscarella lobularis TaxID=121494 RepID=UPI003313FE93